MKKEEIIELLDLKPLLNEGGFIKEMYRGEIINNRSSYGSIYYLLTPKSCSIMHKLDADEIWYYHDGQALEMLLIYDDHYEIKYLGNDLENNQRPQILVPKGVYQGCRMLNDGEYTLVSTSMYPAYDLDGFVVGTYDELKDKTDKLDLLYLLTRQPNCEL